MFERMRQGWDLTKKAWSVVRRHPKLVRLPFIGGALALVAALVIGGPGLWLSTSGTQSTEVVGYVLIALGTYVASCIVIFYNVILAAAANDALMGREPDIRAARSIAMGRFGAIAGWALIAVIVSVLLRAVRERFGAAGALVSWIGAAAWGLVTFLVVPVLALENIGPVEALKRSGELVRRRWGQQVTGNVVIGGLSAVVTMLGAMVAVVGVVLLATGATGSAIVGVLLIAVGIVVAIAAGVIAGATRGVFGVALYHFTADDQALGPFTADVALAARVSTRSAPASIAADAWPDARRSKARTLASNSSVKKGFVR